MAQKYTILKVLIRTSSKGFTLLELIVGMAIMLLIGGLAMNAFIDASNTFRDDKRNIDNDQNMSAILEIIGNDIKQSGEQINDSTFPTVEIKENTISGTVITASSTIIVRRALIPALTLCEPIAANVTPLPTTLLVADSTLTGTTSCLPGTLTTTTIPATINRPSALMEARRYRCKLDDVNADYSAINTTDYCRTTKPSPPIPASSDLEQVWAAISDSSGHIRIFSYTDDNELIDGSDKRYRISVGLFDNGTSTMLATDSRNNGVVYSIGSPIYLIEERRYTLDDKGYLKVSVDGGANFSTLIKGISKFKVSAKLYSDTTTRAIQTAPANGCAGDTQYTCKFNFNTATSDPAYNWKTLAGIKVELQAKYDPTGRNPTPNAKDIEKLTAVAEFFPRNVLSK